MWQNCGIYCGMPRTECGLRYQRWTSTSLRRERRLWAVRGDAQRPYGAPPDRSPVRAGGLSRSVLRVRRNAEVRGQEDVVVGRPQRVRLSLGQCRELGGNLFGQGT